MELKMKKMLSAGTIVELSTSAHADLSDIGSATFVDVTCAVTGLSIETTEREQIDVTALCDTDTKQYLDGIKDADSASSDGFYYPASPEGRALQQVADSSDKHILRVTYNDGSILAYLCTLQPFSPNASVGDAVKSTFNFKLKSAPTRTVPAA